MKYKIPKGSVQKTFMMPLYGRKLAMDLCTNYDELSLFLNANMVAELLGVSISKCSTS